MFYAHENKTKKTSFDGSSVQINDKRTIECDRLGQFVFQQSSVKERRATDFIYTSNDHE